MSSSNEMKRILGIQKDDNAPNLPPADSKVYQLSSTQTVPARAGHDTDRAGDQGMINLDMRDLGNKTGKYSSVMENLHKLGETEDGKSAFALSTSNLNSNADENAEVWKLRCKLLAEKYFSTLKDLKQSN